MLPMLATRGRHVPTDSGWVHEVKWDGMRALFDTNLGQITSRTERRVTVSFPELQPLVASLRGRDALLDGEIVAFDNGIPTFSALGDRIHVSRAADAERAAARNPVTYLIFDLLRLDGVDLTGKPWTVRRDKLTDLGLADDRWQTPDVYDDGDMLFGATDQQGLEGIVSKQRRAPYRPGVRAEEWLKFPHRRRSSWVVVGWRTETDSAHRLGSLVLAEPTPEGLIYRGRVGSGLAGKRAQVIAEVLPGLEIDECPLLELPDEERRETRWLDPLLVVEVESLGLAGLGRLRQPTYKGMRTDLTPTDLLRQGQS